MMDSNNSKVIGYSGFKKVIDNNRFGLNENEIQNLFTGFDVMGNNKIDYEEFLKIIKVNTDRKSVV